MILSILTSLILSSAPLSEEECKRLSDVPQTVPAAANMSEIKRDLLLLRDLSGRKVLEAVSPAFEKSLRELFERDPKTISKLEQFYGLLFLIGQHKTVTDRRVDFQPDDVRKILFSSKVFSTPDVPQAITAVTLFWVRAFEKATYVVTFGQKELALPLNSGRGFATYKEGLCQIAQKLIFYGGFEFDVETTRRDHYYVSKFKNVDLFGQFGSRGIVDVE